MTKFPKGFVWGASAASYQVEGAAFDDGKGWSVWDMLCRKDGAIWNNQVGDVACDHYHRYPEDVALMKEIGLKAYRLSISWPRIMPNGIGAVNAKGLAFYDRLIDELLANNVQPYVTLFHWDYPYELYCRGGWLNPDSPNWFADYVHVVVDKLSDRVKHWMTLNEPQCFIGLGLQEGRHAPGDRLGFAPVLRAGHNALLAHGRAVQVIRATSKGACQIGFAPVGMVAIPATNDPADVNAAREEMFSVRARNCWSNTWWMDPIFFGKYPDDGVNLFGRDMPVIHAGDMETIHQPLDFFGFNNYQGTLYRADSNGKAQVVEYPTGHPITAYYWNVTPDSLYWGPRFFWERYKLPIIVAENGMANADWVALDGKVHDPQRIDYTQRYLLALERATAEGAEVRGYFHWSIMDNFEWAEGTRQRFGLIYVDYASQKRTLKDSAYWYGQVIKTNGDHLHAA